MMAKKIMMHLGARSYPIVIAQDRFRGLGSLLKKLKLGKRMLVVASPDVRRYYGKDLQKALLSSGVWVTFPKRHFPMGRHSEKAKSQKWVDYLVGELVRLSRGGKEVTLAAFSGGVLGDLTGYVAAIYKRGIPYIQIPTTLTAQVDSAIGGKVGIDLPQGKNLLGAFYQPALVYSDLTVLERLPRRHLREGLAEVVKYGVIQDPALFAFLENHHEKLLPPEGRKPDRKALSYVVSRCARLKAAVVERDERDTHGARMILNFGHTLGHAVEKAKGYRISHGRAISVGMVCAAEIACRLGICHRATRERLEALLLQLGLPVRMRGISLKTLLQAESLDKKFVSGKNRYVLPRRIGKVVIREGIPQTLIRQVVSERFV